MTQTIDNRFAFPQSWGSSQRTANNVIIVHETVSYGAWNNAHFFYNNWSTSRTYVQYVIGDGGKIYKLSDEGFVAWGAEKWGNLNAPVQIELARTSDKATFEKDYKVLIDFIRERANAYGIPLILDDSTDRGIKTHKWVAIHKSGNHSDPVDSYLKPYWGITQEQFAKDIANGIASVKQPVANKTFKDIYNIVTTLPNKDFKAYTTYDENGKANEMSNIAPETPWQSGAINVVDGKAYFGIGTGIYIPQEITEFAGKVVINYSKDYGVLAFHKNGTSIPDSNNKFKGATAWRYDKIEDIKGVGYAYRVATDTYIPIKYMQGSGFKG